jgi:hypothetical protein
LATSANSLLQKPGAEGSNPASGGAGDFRGWQGELGDAFGNRLGWYLVKEGRQDQVVHLWAYQSQADREARRDAVYANPAWQDYVREVMAMDFLVSWENKLLTPTWFSPDLGATDQASTEPDPLSS